jgi:hypothetical protein
MYYRLIYAGDVEDAFVKVLNDSYTVTYATPSLIVGFASGGYIVHHLEATPYDTYGYDESGQRLWKLDEVDSTVHNATFVTVAFNNKVYYTIVNEADQYAVLKSVDISGNVNEEVRLEFSTVQQYGYDAFSYLSCYPVLKNNSFIICCTGDGLTSDGQSYPLTFCSDGTKEDKRLDFFQDLYGTYFGYGVDNVFMYFKSDTYKLYSLVDGSKIADIAPAFYIDGLLISPGSITGSETVWVYDNGKVIDKCACYYPLVDGVVNPFCYVQINTILNRMIFYLCIDRPNAKTYAMIYKDGKFIATALAEGGIMAPLYLNDISVTVYNASGWNHALEKAIGVSKYEGVL